MSQELKNKVDSYFWHHSIDLGEGLVTPGVNSEEVCAAKSARIFDRVKMKDATVLDIGAWNGYFSFDAKRRGASRVLATDSFCWDSPKLRGRETFDLAQSRLGLDIEAQEIDAGEISLYSVGKFDVVLYLGVFYHRRDAMESLSRIASSASNLLVVETQLDLLDLDSPAVAYYPGTELRNDASNWWGPNAHFMKAFLLGMGFDEVEVTALPYSPHRAIFHAWRNTDLRLAPIDDKDVFIPAPKRQETPAEEAPPAPSPNSENPQLSMLARLKKRLIG